MNMKKPVIGIMPLWDEKLESMWMLPGYVKGIRDAGGNPLIFPLMDDPQDLEALMALCDGFLLTGGHDVQPSLYNEDPLEDLISDCPIRDRMDQMVLLQAIEDNKPVLGICRGLQLMNVALKGSLYQDLERQYDIKVIHDQDAPYEKPSHRVSVIKNSPLYNCLKEDSFSVNSCHHQAIKDLAPLLEAMAISEDGLIEGVYLKDHPFVWGVQWHPEFAPNTDVSQKIFRTFIQAAAANNRN